MPGMFVTVWPWSGERCWAPWISWIRVVMTGVFVAVGVIVGVGVSPVVVAVAVAVGVAVATPALLRGLGAPVTKSTELLSVSFAPFDWRRSAVVFDGAGAGAVSEQFAVAPKPTRSIVPAGHAPDNAVVE